MTDWTRRLDGLLGELEKGIKGAARAVRETLGDDDPLDLLCYRGYGNGARAEVYGRVKRGRALAPSGAGDSALTNLRNSYRRADADPVPFADVAVSWSGSSVMLKTDDEGFFSGNLALPAPQADVEEWSEYTVELISPAIAAAAGTAAVRAAGEILVPPRTARFGVISDIDDTVLQSRVSNLVHAARTMLFGNARTRLPFPGVAAFYRALRAGAGAHEHNPIFYVSSSPWNVYDMIAEFLDLQEIPRGPILLRDWDIGLGALGASRHFDHKGVAIRKIMQMYPTLPFVLIGDTSQHDPEIYRRLVKDFPGRIPAIYIRDVTRSAERSAAVRALANEMLAARCSLVLAEDTVSAAKHAAAHGWISADALPAIEGEKRTDGGGP
jgi:phosphatidate phosphatase APP1